jgi:hypothetical protein
MQSSLFDAMPGNHNDLEKRLRDAADELRANSQLKDDPRFLSGLPTVDNANYLWIQIFSSALNTPIPIISRITGTPSRTFSGTTPRSSSPTAVNPASVP